MNNTEEWRPVPSFERYYEVSSHGQVKVKPRVLRHPQGPLHRGEKLLKPATNKRGYRTIVLNAEGRRAGFLVHRLVAQAFIPNPENKPEVNHKFGNKSDNRSEVLEWVTNIENISHAVQILCRMGRPPKLNETEARKVKALIRSGAEPVQIAKYLGLEYHIVNDIRRGKAWRNV